MTHDKDANKQPVPVAYGMTGMAKDEQGRWYHDDGGSRFRRQLSLVKQPDPDECQIPGFRNIA